MKKDYSHFEADDFLQDSYFLSWIRNEDIQINSFWEQWQKEHPEKLQVISEAKEHYHLLISSQSIIPSSGEQEEVWQCIEYRIEEHLKYNRKKIRHIRMLQWSAAAAIALVLFGGWFAYKRMHLSKENFVIVKAENDKRKILLADSSVVVLNTHAILKYYPDNARELWLNGEAFFDVKHRGAAYNARHPFIIHAGKEKIAVLGTVFTVKTIQNAARVVLLRGKVKTSVGNKSVLMKPGDKVEWGNHCFSTKQVNPQLYLAWETGEFHFDHTSLKELSELIKDYYGYDLIVKNKTALKTKTISGTVSARSEDLLWKTISLMFDAKVKKDGKQVILTAY